MDGQIVTGEIVDTSSDATAAAPVAPEGKKVRKPRKARATSKFVVLSEDVAVCGVSSYPNIVAARKSIEGPGTYYIACLREEVVVETTMPTPVTKVTVKRVVR